MSEEWQEYLRDPDPWRAPRPLPGPVETGRLTVRTYQRGDGPALYRAVSEHRDALLPWIVWGYTEHQVESDSVFIAERFRRAVEKPDCLDFPMVMIDRATGEVVGGTGFHRIRPQFREAEIGYYVRGDRHGQGLCTEAVGALISRAFTAQDRGGWGFRRIVVFIATANTGSRRVCEKLGLRLEMRMKQERYLGGPTPAPLGGYVDTMGFAVLADEWDFERHRARDGIAWTEPPG